MYKKHGRHNIEVESVNNEVQFASQFFNFMRKHQELIISQVSVPQINLEVNTAMPQVVPSPSSAGSAPDNQKNPMYDINELTPCTLLYVKGRTLRTIEVADAIVMTTRIMHGRPILSECVVVEVTMIREGHEFEDLDHPDEEEGIVKLKDAKGNFILWHRKDIIIKTCSSLIVSLQSREDEGTPTSQNNMHSTVVFTPPSQNPPKTTPPPENPPYTQLLEHHSLKPPHTTPPLQNLSTEQAPQQHSPPHVYSPKSPHTTPPLQIPPNALKKQDATVDETNKDPKTVLDKFYDGLKNYKTKKSLEDLALVGMSVEEFWQHGDKDIWEFEYGKPLVPKYVNLKLTWIMQKLHEWYYLTCVYGLNFIEAKIPGEIFNTSSFKLNDELVELHTIYHLQMLDITMMTIWL
jgi:hypothetical protein